MCIDECRFLHEVVENVVPFFAALAVLIVPTLLVEKIYTAHVLVVVGSYIRFLHSAIPSRRVFRADWLLGATGAIYRGQKIHTGSVLPRACQHVLTGEIYRVISTLQLH